MEFQVPQFIETKPKIIGPLTLAQFFYLLIPAAISFISFQMFNFLAWLLITLIFGSLGVACAFLNINGQPFPKILVSMIKHFWRPRLYFWKREIPQTTLEIPEEILKAKREELSLQEKLKAAVEKITSAKTTPPQKKPFRYAIIKEKTGEKKIVKRVNY